MICYDLSQPSFYFVSGKRSPQICFTVHGTHLASEMNISENHVQVIRYKI